MKILVLFDSAFGNTEKIASAIAEPLKEYHEVDFRKFIDVSPDSLNTYDLIIAGSPTQKFMPLPLVSKYLKNIPKDSLKGIKVATFDTRIELETIESKMLRKAVDKGGYAAKSIMKRLKKKGGDPVCEPEGFLVTGEKGPLKEGELERAHEWVQKFIKNDIS